MTSGRQWHARPLLSATLRVALGAGAVLLAAGTGLVVGLAVPAHWTAVGRAALAGLAAVVVLILTDRLARRLLPLPWLLQLTLSFPDEAPNRLRTALRAGSTRSLHHALDRYHREGQNADPGPAARSILELLGALARHDRGTRRHSERVRAFVDLLADRLGVSDEDANQLRWAALLHDIGKLQVDRQLLNKPGRPDQREWETLRGHPAAGAALVEPLRPFLGSWVDAVGQHHERWDGGGYPAGLAGNQIGLAARVVAVADAFEVMTSKRPYSRPLDLHHARIEVLRNSETQFDPEVVRALLALSLKPLGLRWWAISGGVGATAGLAAGFDPVTTAPGTALHHMALPAGAASGHVAGGSHGPGHNTAHHTATDQDQ